MMENLKKEATELGLDFKGNISKKDLQAMIDEKKQTADGSPDTENVNMNDTNDKIKVRITARDSGEIDGYARLNKYEIQFQFDEVIEIPKFMAEFIKSKGGYITSPKGEKKWQSRYIVEYV